MKTKNMLCVVLLVLAAACSAEGQQNQPPAANPGVEPPPLAAASQTQVTPASPPASYQVQPLPGDSSGTNCTEWPTYPYPQYHNPYYDGAHQVRSFVSGTLDWLLNVPSNLYDRFSNIVDGAFFPPAPATSGSRQGSQVLGRPSSPAQPPAPAAVPPAAVPASQPK